MVAKNYKHKIQKTRETEKMSVFLISIFATKLFICVGICSSVQVCKKILIFTRFMRFLLAPC